MIPAKPVNEILDTVDSAPLEPSFTLVADLAKEAGLVNTDGTLNLSMTAGAGGSLWSKIKNFLSEKPQVENEPVITLLEEEPVVNIKILEEEPNIQPGQVTSHLARIYDFLVMGNDEDLTMQSIKALFAEYNIPIPSNAEGLGPKDLLTRQLKELIYFLNGYEELSVSAMRRVVANQVKSPNLAENINILRQPDGISCIPYSIGIALDIARGKGITVPAGIDPENIRSKAYTQGAGYQFGNVVWRAKDLLKDSNVDIEMKYGEYNWDEIFTALYESTGVLLIRDRSHASLVVGYEIRNNRLYFQVADPMLGRVVEKEAMELAKNISLRGSEVVRADGEDDIPVNFDKDTCFITWGGISKIADQIKIN